MRAADRVRVLVPRWWGGAGGLAGRVGMAATFPLEVVFRGLVGARTRLYDLGLLGSRRAEVPVISVGNLTVGGTGKTPVASWVVGELVRAGRRPALVLRERGIDEMSVHRELAPDVPVLAARSRIRGVMQAAAAGSDCVVLDDAFQHRALERDLDIVLLAAEQWGGTVRLLPRGRWREPPSAARRADFVLVTRKTATRERAEAILETFGRRGCGGMGGIAHLAADHLVPLVGGEQIPLEALSGWRVLAVSSLAEPGSFVEQLAAGGLEVESLAFPDHHSFGERDIGTIRRRAAGRTVVVTRKEAVKLRDSMGDSTVYVLEQRVVMEKGGEMLIAAIGRAAGVSG